MLTIQSVNSGTSNALTLQSNNTTAMTIDTSQNVGIGTTSPAWVLDISSAQANMRLTSATGTNNTLYRAVNTGGTFYSGLENSTGSSFGAAYSGVMWHSGAYPLVFGTSNTERMRIDTSGNLLVGQTSVSYGGKICTSFNNTTQVALALTDSATTYTGNYVVFINSSGTTAGGIAHNGASTVAYNTSSDYRLKENVAPITTGLATINALKPVSYDWISDKSKGEGFIAHELQAVVPLAVTGEKDAVDAEGKPVYQGVDYSKIVVHLVAALQELSAEVTALKAKVGA